MKWEATSPDEQRPGVTWSMTYEGSPLPSALPQCFLAINAHNWGRVGDEKRGRLEAAVADYAGRVRRPLSWRAHEAVNNLGEREGEVYLGPIPWDGELHREVVRILPRGCPLSAFDLNANVTREERPKRTRAVAPGPLDEDDDDNAAGEAAAT